MYVLMAYDGSVKGLPRALLSQQNSGSNELSAKYGRRA